MSFLARTPSPSDQPIAWNDIEALPVYAAILLAAVCLLFALLDGTPTIHATTMEAIGIMGSLALRHAWLKLDEEM